MTVAPSCKGGAAQLPDSTRSEKEHQAMIDEKLLETAYRHATKYLGTLPSRHVGARATREEMMASLSLPIPARGDDPAKVIEALASQADRGAIASAGPRYFGFVIGGTLPVAIAADWLTTAWDQNGGIYVTSPLLSVIEDVAHTWLLDLFGLPADAGLGFVTGGQMANFTCLAAARNAVMRDAGWDIEAKGFEGAPKVNIVMGDEAHVTIHVALRMLGFGTQNAVRVASDGQGRMRADALEKALAGLEGATIVCAQAGNVNSGSFDPFSDITPITRARGAWLHVDSAFGLWARASRLKRPLAEGVENADSWATDAHKWLNVPYDCGVAIVRDAKAHRAAMTSVAPYLQQTKGVERDALDWSPEFSRRGRGVPVYAALRTLGREGVEEMIDRNCAQASLFADLLRKNRRVSILNDVVLNQVLVRFDDSDERTREVIANVQQDGTCWLAGTTWQGKGAMRISVSNWSTTDDDIARSAEAVLRALDE